MNPSAMHYTARERFWFAVLATVGFVVINGAFVWGLLFDPDALLQTLRNPIAVAFVVEAFLLLGVLAYLLRKWGVNPVGSFWFILLGLVGSIAFALPVVLLLGSRGGGASDPG